MRGFEAEKEREENVTQSALEPFAEKVSHQTFWFPSVAVLWSLAEDSISVSRVLHF